VFGTFLRTAARAVGVPDPIGTHTLRKTFGDHAYRRGIDLALLRDLLNHSSPATSGFRAATGLRCIGGSIGKPIEVQSANALPTKP
jgi:hypothetical protein